MNPGKVFENDFAASVPKSVWCYRLRDGSAAWGGGKKDNDSKTRFQASNIADYLLFDDNAGTLAIVENKSVKTPSLPFADIRYGNLTQMVKAAADRKHLTAWVVINYRGKAQTYAVPAADVKDYMDAGTRKSIPIAWAAEHGITIPQHMKKTHYTYDLRPLLTTMAA